MPSYFASNWRLPLSQDPCRLILSPLRVPVPSSRDRLGGSAQSDDATVTHRTSRDCHHDGLTALPRRERQFVADHRAPIGRVANLRQAGALAIASTTVGKPITPARIPCPPLPLGCCVTFKCYATCQPVRPCLHRDPAILHIAVKPAKGSSKRHASFQQEFMRRNFLRCDHLGIHVRGNGGAQTVGN